jgi:hypothetical protein
LNQPIAFIVTFITPISLVCCSNIVFFIITSFKTENRYKNAIKPNTLYCLCQTIHNNRNFMDFSNYWRFYTNVCVFKNCFSLKRITRRVYFYILYM